MKKILIGLLISASFASFAKTVVFTVDSAVKKDNSQIIKMSNKGVHVGALNCEMAGNVFIIPNVAVLYGLHDNICVGVLQSILGGTGNKNSVELTFKVYDQPIQHGFHDIVGEFSSIKFKE